MYVSTYLIHKKSQQTSVVPVAVFRPFACLNHMAARIFGNGEVSTFFNPVASRASGQICPLKIQYIVFIE